MEIDRTALGNKEVSLFPSYAESVLSDEESAPHALYAILRELRKVPNDSDSSDEDNQSDEVQRTETQPAEDSVPEVPDLPGLAHVMANEDFISHESDESVYSLRAFWRRFSGYLPQILRFPITN